jgi:hypothetical protein
VVYAGGIHEEMSRMDTATRIARAGSRMTPKQRRRMVKKAGRDPYAIVVVDNGMGYPPSMQGYREVVAARHAPAPDELS